MAGASSALQTKRELGKATRDAFGRALEALGADHPNVVVVDGDVGNSTRTEWFGKKYPERFFNVGIAESNLVGVAAGLAASGKTSVIASFAAFITCNAYDQLRMSVAYPHLNVKVVGSHAGISIGEDGASQMGIEDVALACALPGFVVIVPADEDSTKAATSAMIEHDGPVYLRCGRPEVPKIYGGGGPTPFQIGVANQLRDGTDVTIVANGLMVAPALDAAETLAGAGINAARYRHAHRQADRPRGARIRCQADRCHRRRRGTPRPRRTGQRRRHDDRRDPSGADPIRQPRRPVRRERCARCLARKVRPHGRQDRRGGEGRRRGEGAVGERWMPSPFFRSW